jgi:hypothetical protein
MQEGLPRKLWCRNFAHLMQVGLPICVLAKEVVEIAIHLASGMVERRHPTVATRVSVKKRQWSFSIIYVMQYITRYIVYRGVLWMSSRHQQPAQHPDPGRQSSAAVAPAAQLCERWRDTQGSRGQALFVSPRS